MSTEHVITWKAEEGTLTVSELWQFLKEFDKAVDRKDPDAPPLLDWYGLKVKARVSFSGGIKSITVTIPGDGTGQ